MKTRIKSVALLDLNYTFKKRFHTTDPQSGEPMAAAKATLRDIAKLAEGVEHLIICRDAPPYLRKAIFEGYKAKREQPTPEERAQKIWLFEEIRRLGYNVAWSQGYEADDVIATLAKEYGVWCEDVRIVCPDKDAAQCVTENVIQYIPPVGDKDWEIRDAAGVVEKFGVPPKLMPMYQALAGDSTDNIPGVKLIGKVKAAELVNKYPSVGQLAEAMTTYATDPKALAFWKSLGANWESGFIMSLKLTTLDTNVPVDSESLLVHREPEPERRAHNDMDVPFDGFIGNETPHTPVPPVGPPTVTDAVFEQAKKVYETRVNESRYVANDATASKDDGLLEREYEREQGENEEHVAPPPPPKPAPAMRVSGPGRKPDRAAQTTALVRQIAAHPKYGLVSHDLQPLDLQSAYTLSEWLVKSNLYTQFKTESQVFAIMLRGKELGVGVTTALAGHHIIDGKPVATADFIRALCERDKSFEYLYPTELSGTRCTWAGKRTNNPREVLFTYTIEEAAQAKLTRLGDYGSNSNWSKRPQDMLSKTAASKLARILWPAATMGLYCPEEMGSSEEELQERYAA